jgi:HEAT repeat protein
MAASSPKKLAQELGQLRDRESCSSDGGTRLLRQALATGEPPLIVQAAQLVGAHTLHELSDALRDAWSALARADAKLDVGCLARTGLLTALDALDCGEAELFAEGARYEQLERMKGGIRDTAAPVRARGVLGLARLGHADFLPILGACLGDRDGTVRLAAARALGHRGQRDGAGLLLLRLSLGDREPEVGNECLRALFATAPDLAVGKAATLLRDAEGESREQTLHALGATPHDGAVELLVHELEQHTLSEERKPIIEALGLSLRPSARAYLLTLVEGDRDADGEAALSALAIHRYDLRLVEQLRAASAHAPVLARRFREQYER